MTRLLIIPLLLGITSCSPLKPNLSNIPSGEHKDASKVILSSYPKKDAVEIYNAGHRVLVMSLGGLVLPIGVEEPEDIYDTFTALRYEVDESQKVAAVSDMLTDPEGTPHPFEDMSIEREAFYQSRTWYGARFNTTMLELHKLSLENKTLHPTADRG